MPTTFAHLYFGNQVLKELEPQLQSSINQWKELYYIGLHGPDILFYYKPMGKNPINSLGYAMHREKSADFFRACKNTIDKSKNREAALAYVLGFICHFALDSECHGYVGRWEKQTGVSHSEIEMELDKHLLKKQKLNPGKFDATAQIVASERNAGIIAPFFGLPAKQVREAISAMKWYCSLFRNLRGVGRKLVFLVLKLTGHYRGMAGMFVTETDNPLCEQSNRELAGRLSLAVPVAKELINAYMRYDTRKEPLPKRFERNYGG